MFKHFKLAAVALLISAGFTACSDDDDNDFIVDPVTPVSTSAYVVLQGNMASGVLGEIDQLNFKDSTVTSNVFKTTNGMALGDTPQAAVRYGSKVYIPVFNSNLVWVADATTLKIQGQVKTSSPQAVCGADGYVFVANNDGFVSRIDTLNFTAEPQKLAVGPNPYRLAAANGKVYVTISDGYNYGNNYQDGKKVVAIDTRNFTKANEYAVDINPGQIVANSKGELFVLIQGNYADVTPKVQKIGVDGKVTDFCDGAMIAMDKDNLIVLDYTADYANNNVVFKSSRYNTLTGEREDEFIDTENEPLMPNAIDVNPSNGHIFICSDNGPMGFSGNGYVYEYESNGKFVYRYNVGIHPFGVVFK